MGHSKAGVSKAAKGAVAEGDVPRAGKGIMTDRQFESHEAKSSQTASTNNSSNGSGHDTNTSQHRQTSKVQTDMASPAAQSGMFRQLTGGLESVITAIVDAMPSNVHLYTGTLVSNIRYVEGMYAIDVENSGNDACGCQSHSKSIRTASINAENRVEASDSTTDSAIEVLPLYGAIKLCYCYYGL